MTDFSHRGKRAEEAKGSQLEFRFICGPPSTGPWKQLPGAQTVSLTVAPPSHQRTATSCKSKASPHRMHTAVVESRYFTSVIPKVNYTSFSSCLSKKKKKKTQGQINLRTTVNSASQLEHRKTHINLLKTLREPTTKRQVWLDSTHVFLNSFHHETFTFL